MDGYFECQQINKRFDNQEIFKAVLYADGTIKMPDGQILTPRKPYDASMIYKQNPKVREEAKAIYNGSEAKIIKVDVQDSTIKDVMKDREASQDNMPQEPAIKHISNKR